MNYLIPVLILGGCGVLAGVLLTVAAKVFHVEIDERIDRIAESLPQANCGSCGFAGCSDYAAAIIEKGAETNLCRPGGADAAGKIAAILGTSAAEVVPMTAIVHCNGNCEATQKRFEFDGVQSCTAAKRFYGGNGMCRFGCLGYGDCMAVCEKGAIKVVNGVAEVSPAQCEACGKCAAVCPNGLISIKPVAKRIDVLCSSAANGRETKESCKNGCIGCKMCEKKCPSGAIKVENFHASIDYDKCEGCGECVEICPVKAIHKQKECNIDNKYSL
ncbi:MAG: RnfABCDGE type electron transport complex subunit B [Ruminococcus sp.]|nr:RnfABCDGE type electron transport complex subunit B [Ruminococcus sp.]